jgi:hypothetical protein
MSGRMSAATERALARVAKGAVPLHAARIEGIDPRTMYRALARQRALQATNRPGKISPSRPRARKAR